MTTLDQGTADKTQAPLAEPPKGPISRVLHNFVRHPKGMFALALLLALIASVTMGPLVYDVDPTKVDLALTMAPPSAEHPLGTDENGRDVLSRLLEGGRVSLMVGFAAMFVSVGLGVLLGSSAGYLGGWTDRLIMQLVDGIMAVPLFFLWLIFLTSVPPTPLSIVLVIGCTSWMPTARVVRSEVLKTRELEFVEAARALGASRVRILLRHCLPQATSSIIVSATLAAAFAIISESALSFLGIGIQPPRPSWGNMLTGAQEYLFAAPSLAIYPGVAIVLLVLSLNLLGDALRDVLSPRG